MQIEHKTEKGTILFMLAPEEATGYKIIESPCLSIEFDIKYGIDKEYVDILKGFQLIGLTSDITEEQAKMMVDSVDGISDTYFKDYLIAKHSSKFQFACISALDSLKSLMQHLQVYEVNPFSNECKCRVGENQEIYDKCLSEIKNHTEAQSRTGKWLALFKPE